MELITVRYMAITITTTITTISTISTTNIIMIMTRKREGGGELSAVGREWQVTRSRSKFLQIN